MSLVDENWPVPARHLNVFVDKLTTPFVNNGWCLAREEAFDERIGEKPLFGAVSVSLCEH